MTELALKIEQDGNAWRASMTVADGSEVARHFDAEADAEDWVDDMREAWRLGAEEARS